MPTIHAIDKAPVANHSQQQRGLHITSLEQGGIRELHVTILPRPGEHVVSMLHRLADVLKEHKARIVKQQIFGSSSIRCETLRLLGIIVGKVCWPVSWIESGSESRAPIAGMHVFAVAGASVTTVTQHQKTIGCVFEDQYARHLLLGDLTSSDSSASEAVQTRQLYDQLESSLRCAEMRLKDVARTWFFLTDILTWYDAFNKVRNVVYDEAKPKPAFLPASTGVGIPGQGRGALLVEAYAVQPLDNGFVMRPVDSPLQGAATSYGSSFCRALEIATPETRRILISGTASIDGAGRTLHIDDMACQVDQTMRVVEGILKAQKLSWNHVSRATAYFKNIAEVPVFTSWCESHGLNALPVILTQADVCRDELLFEIEVDAIC